MKITYRTLAKLIEKMSDEQKDSDVTVEDLFNNECWAAELRICGHNHDSLDEFHPVLAFATMDDDIKIDDIDKICKDIGLE